MYGPTTDDGAIPVVYSTIQLNRDVFRRLLEADWFNRCPNIKYNWMKQRLECHIMYAYTSTVVYFEIYEADTPDVKTPEQLVSRIIREFESEINWN